MRPATIAAEGRDVGERPPLVDALRQIEQGFAPIAPCTDHLWAADSAAYLAFMAHEVETHEVEHLVSSDKHLQTLAITLVESEANLEPGANVRDGTRADGAAEPDHADSWPRSLLAMLTFASRSIKAVTA